MFATRLSSQFLNALHYAVHDKLAQCEDNGHEEAREPHYVISEVRPHAWYRYEEIDVENTATIEHGSTWAHACIVRTDHAYLRDCAVSKTCTATVYNRERNDIKTSVSKTLIKSNMSRTRTRWAPHISEVLWDIPRQIPVVEVG